MMKTIQAYACDYCTKFVSKHRDSAHRHEKNCPYNPETRACNSCTNFIEQEWIEDYCEFGEHRQLSGFHKACSMGLDWTRNCTHWESQIVA